MVIGYSQLEPLELGAPTDAQVRAQVWEILSGLYPPGANANRRLSQRFPYPQLLYLTPVDHDGLSLVGQSVVVVGKHLSEGGLGFYYQREPLPYRRMIASLEVQGSRWTSFLLEIVWYRFTEFGWYESGGRFLQAVAVPLSLRQPARD
jgi:hypothetical protein